MNWKLTLTYDGTTFHGWQVQPNLPTIQGTLAAALHLLTGESVLPQGSGRTDAGVHALAQVCSFHLSAPIPVPNLLLALNRALPPSIRVLSADLVPNTFHARHAALRKTYEYRLFPRQLVRVPRVPLLRPGSPNSPDRICSPFLAPYVWDCRWPMDPDLLLQAAPDLLGTHDFTSFAASDPDLTQRNSDAQGAPSIRRTLADGWGADIPGGMPNPTKTIDTSTFAYRDDLLIYTVTGSGFLHHMVRNIVGTLVEIARGALPPDSIPRILAQKDRKAAGPTAPPNGLFLHSVEYEESTT